MDAYQENKNKLRALVRQLDECPPEQGRALLDGFIRDYDADLYHEVGRLARQLHDSLTTVQDEQRLVNLTQADIPDAKERLRYVVNVTEQATQNVLSLVEQSVPVSQHIGRQAEALKRQCEAEDGAQHPELLQAVSLFLEQAHQGSALLNNHLNGILMAQEYQDITGQIIRKVVNLVQEVEESLVKMITMTGRRPDVASGRPAAAALGPAVPGVDDAAARLGGQDDVDALLASLGF